MCLTLCDPMDFSLPDSSVHVILQARILEWVAISSSRGSSQPCDWTHFLYVSYIGRRVHIVKAIIFPVVIYGCESCTVKKEKHWRTDAFQLVVLEKTPESPLDSKEIKPVNLKKNQPWVTYWKDQCWGWSSNVLVTWWK